MIDDCASMREGWIMTASGRCFWPLDPRAEDIDIRDIAHALGHCCRFQGMTSQFYSVAEHSVRVSLGVPAADALYGLLHDASEAYLGDVPRPLKAQPAFAPYREAERRLQRLIYAHFGLDPDAEPETVKLLDRRMLRAEQRDLMPPPVPGEVRDDVAPWPAGSLCLQPQGATNVFLARFYALTLS